MRAFSRVGIALSWLLVAIPAAAQEPTERRPVIDVTMAAGHAKLTVRRSWHNPEETGELVTAFSIPELGVLTDFRAQSLGGSWLRTRLLPTDEAQKVFDGQGSLGGDAALLASSFASGHFSLTMAPFPASSTRTVEYTVLLPTSYAEGRHQLFNPARAAQTSDELVPRVRARAVPGAGKLTIDAIDIAKAADTKGEVTGEMFELTPHRAPQLSGGLAFIALAGDRRALRYRIEAAPKLGEAPKKAHVVLILDNSRSLDETQGRGMVAAARAYLGHLPDARVDVITFDREVKSLLGELSTTSEADAALGALTMQRKNGSDVPAALALAKARLAALPKTANKRVVLFTDTLTKASIEAADLGLADLGALTHVAVVDRDVLELERLDLHAWSPVVERTGGVIWNAPARPDADRARLMEIYEELVRPLRIHRLELSIPSAPELEKEVGEALREGGGLSGLSFADDHDPRVVLTGALWSKKVRFVLDPSLRETRLWEGLLLGSALASELTADEVRALALKANAASEQTSFVAATTGRRHIERGMGLGGFGTSSGCRCRMAFARQKVIPFARPEQWLKETVAAELKRCHGGDRAARVVLEMTHDEIVDVTVETSAPALAKCMEKALWDVVLPAGFGADEKSATFAMSLPAAPPDKP